MIIIGIPEVCPILLYKEVKDVLRPMIICVSTSKYTDYNAFNLYGDV